MRPKPHNPHLVTVTTNVQFHPHIPLNLYQFHLAHSLHVTNTISISLNTINHTWNPTHHTHYQFITKPTLYHDIKYKHEHMHDIETESTIQTQTAPSMVHMQYEEAVLATLLAKWHHYQGSVSSSIRNTLGDDDANWVWREESIM